MTDRTLETIIAVVWGTIIMIGVFIGLFLLQVRSGYCENIQKQYPTLEISDSFLGHCKLKHNGNIYQQGTSEWFKIINSIKK